MISDFANFPDLPGTAHVSLRFREIPLLALEFKQMREQSPLVLLFAGRAIDAETMTDVDGQPALDRPSGHDENENFNATLFESDEGQSKSIRICLAPSNTRQVETHVAHAVQQETRELDAFSLRQHARWQDLSILTSFRV